MYRLAWRWRVVVANVRESDSFRSAQSARGKHAESDEHRVQDVFFFLNLSIC